MKPKFLSLLTVVAAALGAIVAIALPYAYGIFPGGILESSAIGRVPLWVCLLALSIVMLVVFVGHIRNMMRSD